MPEKIDPAVAALFGSKTRALTLATLANAGIPLTAYRIAQVAGTQVIKTVTELRRLERGGLVLRSPTDLGRSGWILADKSLADFFRRLVRLFWLADWNKVIDKRVRSRNRSRPVAINLARFPPNPEAVPNPGEFIRSPEKDRILARAGLPTSRRVAENR